MALGGWTMTQTFSLSTTQAVHTDKLDKLERATDKLREQMDDMLKVDEDIMEQHDRFIRLYKITITITIVIQATIIRS